MTVDATKGKIATEFVDNCCCDEFSVISYNVNGLSNERSYVIERCKEICRLVSQESPDLIFFQETTNETSLIYSMLLHPHGYRLVSSQQSVQSTIFTVAFSRHIGECQRINFTGAATSVMGRDLLKFDLFINNRKSQFLSGHLESLGEYSKIRIAQLEYALDTIGIFQGSAILVGDLNIRSKEAEGIIKKLKKKSKDNSELFKIVDCWEYLGKQDNNKNTWICAEPTLSHIQARYDRMYFNGVFMTPIEFRLIGKDVMLPPILTTPSDHFGIYAKFSVDKQQVDCNDSSSSSSSSSSCSNSSGKSGNNKVSIDNDKRSATSSRLNIESLHRIDVRQTIINKFDEDHICNHNVDDNHPNIDSKNHNDEDNTKNGSKICNDINMTVEPYTKIQMCENKNYLRNNDDVIEDSEIKEGRSKDMNGMNNKKRKIEVVPGVEVDVDVGIRRRLMAAAAMKRFVGSEKMEESVRGTASLTNSCALSLINSNLSAGSATTDNDDNNYDKSDIISINVNDNDIFNDYDKDGTDDSDDRIYSSDSNKSVIDITDSPPQESQENNQLLIKLNSNFHDDLKKNTIYLLDD